MRTTLNLDQDAMKILHAHARKQKVSMGEAASELIRRGASMSPRFRLENGIFVFDLPKGGKKITSKRVKELESEIDLAKYT